MILLNSCLNQTGYIQEFTFELQPQVFLQLLTTAQSKVLAGQSMWLSHKSVWVRTSSVSSISCLGMKGNKIFYSFLVFCQFPRVLPRERGLVRYIIRHCLLPALEKSSTYLPCFSQAPSSSTSSNVDWMDLGFSPNQRVYVCFSFLTWQCSCSKDLKAFGYQVEIGGERERNV